MINMGSAVDIMPTPKPAMMLVAAPVCDCLMIFNTGFLPPPV